MDKLLTCPFCGDDPTFNPAYIIKGKDGKPATKIGGCPEIEANIYCECQVFEDQGAYGGRPVYGEAASLDKSNQQAFELWNHRPVEDILRKHIVELQAKIIDLNARLKNK